MADLAKIKRNVAKMAEMDAPEVDIDGYIASEGVTVDDVRNFKIEPSFVGGVKDAYNKRLSNMEGMANLYEQDMQTKGETMAQMGGQGVAFSGDVMGEAVKSLGRGISAITPDAIENPIKSGAEFIGKAALNTPQGKMALTALEMGKRGYDKLEEVSPRSARNLDAVANIGMALPVGIKAGVPLVKKAEKALNVKTIAPTVQNIADKSTELYASAKKMGAEFSPKVLDEVYQAGFKNLPESDSAEIAGRLIKPDDADKFVQNLKKELGNSPKLQDFSRIDSYLGEKAASSYLTDRSLSRKYTDLQVSLRDAVENPVNVIGSPEGAKAHREATRLWGIKKKMEEVERAISIGSDYEVPATGIKTQFRRIKDNPKLMRGFSAEEKKLITKAAETGEFEGIVKALGSRLNIIGGVIHGGAAGAATAGALSMAGRKGTELYRAAKGQKVLDSLVNRSGLAKTERRTDKLVKPVKEAISSAKNRFAKNKEVVEEATDKTPKLLGYTPESPIYKTNRQGVASKMTQADKEVAESARKKATETGLTPDVRRSQIVNQVNKAYEQRGLQRNAVKEAEIAKIAEKSEVPIETLVELADKNIKELANLVGLKNSDTAFAAALKIAIKNKGKK